MRQLRIQRRDEWLRLDNLKRRLATMDPERHGRAMVVLQEAAQVSVDQLAAIDAELTGARELRQNPQDVSAPNDADFSVVSGAPDITGQAKDALRQRLQHLDLVVQRHAPPACDAPARRLRHAIALEMRRLT